MGSVLINNILCISGISLLLGIEVLVYMALIASWIPMPVPEITAMLFERHRVLVMPEREMMLYRLWLLASLIIHGVLLYMYRLQINSEDLLRKNRRWLMLEAMWVFLMAFIIFKIFIYGYPLWTKVICGLILAINLAYKIFFHEINQILIGAYRFIKAFCQKTPNLIYIDVWVIITIAMLVLVVDIQGMLAKMMMTDHFLHLDTMIMAPAWAFLKGAVLNVEHFTHYSIGLPILVSILTKGVGGFSYEAVVTVLMILTTGYYVAFYLFVRNWLGSIVLAFSAVIVLIKWQMFHPGTAPIIFNYPSALPVRHVFDIIVFLLLMGHMRTCQTWYLYVISLLCGFSMFYMIDTGVYLSFSWIMYLLLRVYYQRKENGYGRSLLNVGTHGMLILAVLISCLWFTQGTALFTEQFWINMTERTSLFLSGHGNLPVYKSLVEGRFLESIVGLIIPIGYIFVGLYMMAMIVFNQAKEKDLFVVMLVIYGLASYHYYIVRSADTSYYVVIAPAVLLLAWLIAQIKLIDHTKFLVISKICCGGAIFSLLTNHYFINYYNSISFPWRSWVKPVIKEQLVDGRSFLNHHHVVWGEQVKLPLNSLGDKNEDLRIEKDFSSDKEFREYFKKEFDFTSDAALIQKLTLPDKPVALLSSYETRILMQADRKPFFYYFPLVDSRPMRMRMFNMTTLWTTERLKKTLVQLDQQKPEYVFMEKIFLNKSVPAAYQWLYPEVIILLTSIFQHYEPVEEGYYLVALKRK